MATYETANLFPLRSHYWDRAPVPVPKDGVANRIAACLEESVFFQPEAAQIVAQRLALARTEFTNSDRPRGSFIFTGPPGVGKTEMGRAIAAQLFGTPQTDRLLILNMGEFGSPHTADRFTGSPPSYVGGDESAAIPHAWLHKLDKTGVVIPSVIVFDEIEKADGRIPQLLLSVLDTGSMSARNGKRGFEPLDFRSSFIVMTSNAGSAEMRRVANHRSMGFIKAKGAVIETEVERVAIKRLKEMFPPEFLDRVDATVVFRELNRERGDLHVILRKFLDQVNARSQRLWTHGGNNAGYSQHPILNITKELADYLVDQLDPNEGARRLRSVFEGNVLALIPDYIKDRRVNDGQMVAGYEGGCVVFYGNE